GRARVPDAEQPFSGDRGAGGDPLEVPPPRRAAGVAMDDGGHRSTAGGPRGARRRWLPAARHRVRAGGSRPASVVVGVGHGATWGGRTSAGAVESALSGLSVGVGRPRGTTSGCRRVVVD